MLERLGRFEIKAELGRGGFGRVYRAFDPTMGRMVAIKVLNADGDADLLVRFRNEAVASGGLQHPNIVTIHDFGEQDGLPYIVMELVEGEDLQRFIASRNAMSLLEKVRVMSQIAAGLGHAHAHGIIHRDVKPANFMLLADRSVKIMDFGIALISKGTHSRLTPQGAMVGTFRYMAPEQFLGSEPDARSDIFAYGLVFYELLAGVHPFHAPEAAALMYNILHLDPVPVDELCPDCPELLATIVGRLLNREPDLRYQILEDVLFDCEPVLLELQKAKASDLVAQARQLKAETQAEAAQALVRQALELDPANRAARELREELQKEFRRRAIQPRIQDLLRKAEDQLAAGNFSDAIQRFESALRLDPGDADIRQALEKARAHFAESRRLEQLLSDANHSLHAGELTSAQRHGSEALRIAPDDARVKELMRRLQRELAERERQRRLAEDVDRARRLIEVQAWTEAGTLLSKLASEFPGHSEIAALSSQARAGKEEKERKQRLADGLSKAREEIQIGQLASALNRLRMLSVEFPAATELQHLLSFAEAETRGQAKRQLIDRTISTAEAFLLEDQFLEAKECIEAALAACPGEPVLERELRSVETAALRARRRSALQEALKSAESLRSLKHLEEAVQVLEDFKNRYGEEKAVEDLMVVLKAEIEEERRAAELRYIVRRAKDLLLRENAEPAAEFLKESISRFQHQPQLLTLLDAAQNRVEEQRRRKAIETAVAETDTHLRLDELARANEVVTAAILKYPDSEALLSLRRQVDLRVVEQPDSRGGPMLPKQEASPETERRPLTHPGVKSNSQPQLRAQIPAKGNNFWWVPALGAVVLVAALAGSYLMLHRPVPQALSGEPKAKEKSEQVRVQPPPPRTNVPETARPSLPVGGAILSTKLPGVESGSDKSRVAASKPVPPASEGTRSTESGRTRPSLTPLNVPELHVHPTTAVDSHLPSAPNIKTDGGGPVQTPPDSLPTPPPPPVSAPSPSAIPSADTAAIQAKEEGVQLANGRHYSEAIGSFSRALQANPNFADAYLNRGITYQAWGKYAEAIADYDNALKLNPADARAAARKKEAQSLLRAGVQGPASGADAPTLLDITMPRYSKEAKAAGVRGVVTVGFIVDEEGVAKNVRVLSPLGYGLDDLAVRAVKAARYRPARKRGRPVAYAVNLDIRFRD